MDDYSSSSSSGAGTGSAATPFPGWGGAGDGDHAPRFLTAAGLYLTVEDFIRVTSFGSVSGVTLALEGRLAARDARIIPIAEVHAPLSNRTAVTTVKVVTEGYLIGLHVRASAGTVTRGGVYVIVEVVRGRGDGGVQPLHTLVEGYVQTNGRLQWPWGYNEPSVNGQGLLRSVLGGAPAAGADISDTVPAGARWRLQSALFALTTDAVAGTRSPVMQIFDGTNTIAEYGSVTTQGPSHAWRWTFSPSGSPVVAANSVSVGVAIAPLVLLAGWSIKTSTVALDVGDQYAAARYLVEEWLEP